MVGHDLQVLFVKLEQILHLKVDCSDFGPIWPCSGQGQFTLPRVNGQILDGTEIRTPNFQLQYLSARALLKKEPHNHA